MLTSNALRSKQLSKNTLQLVGDFLEPASAQKMKETSRQWRNMKIYENIFPDGLEVAVFRHINTGEIMWESIQVTELLTKNLYQEELMSHLRRSDAAKWNDVFQWFTQNPAHRFVNNKSLNDAFLKELMLAIAENVDFTIASWPWYKYPLMLAVINYNWIDSILTLIKRGADVNQQDGYSRTALHFAAKYGNINACEILLDNGANIDAANCYGETPLMYAKLHRKYNVFGFLLGKGADKNLQNPLFYERR